MFATPPVNAVAGALRSVLAALNQASAADWAELDLSMGQLKVLFILHDSPSISVGNVAARLGIGLPAASALTDRLVQADLARRSGDPSDRRRVLLALTPEGGALAGRLRQGRLAVLAGWIATLGADDLAALDRGLRALSAAIAAEPAPAAPVTPPAAAGARP